MFLIERSGQDITEFVIPSSIRIRNIISGENDTVQFNEINSGDYSLVIPDANQLVTIYADTSKTFKLYEGFTQRVSDKVLTLENTDYLHSWNIEGIDYTSDINKKLVAEQWVNKTTGFIFRDIFQRYTDKDYYDISDVPTGGIFLEDWRAKQEEVTALLDKLAEIEQGSWYVDYNRKVHFNNSEEYEYAPFVLNDATVDFLCGNTLVIEPDTTQLSNKIKFFYKTKYTEGTARVTQNSKIVTGTGTEWTTKITPGSKFKKLNGTAEYAIQSVDSDTQITLTSDYNESSELTISYEMFDVPTALIARDMTSISLLEALTGRSGEYELAIFDNNNYSFKEAQEVAKSHLKMHSNQMVHFKMSISSRHLYELDSTKIPFVRSGQRVPMNLTKRRVLSGEFVIKAVDITFLGGIIDNIDFPLLRYDIDFTSRLYDLAYAIRRLYRDIRKIQMPENYIIEDVFDMLENVKIIDLFDVADIPELFTGNQIVDIDDYFNLDSIQLWPGVYGVTKYGYSMYTDGSFFFERLPSPIAEEEIFISDSFIVPEDIEAAADNISISDTFNVFEIGIYGISKYGEAVYG